MESNDPLGQFSWNGRQCKPPGRFQVLLLEHKALILLIIVITLGDIPKIFIQAGIFILEYDGIASPMGRDQAVGHPMDGTVKIAVGGATLQLLMAAPTSTRGLVKVLEPIDSGLNKVTQGSGLFLPPGLVTINLSQLIQSNKEVDSQGVELGYVVAIAIKMRFNVAPEFAAICQTLASQSLIIRGWT